MNPFRRIARAFSKAESAKPDASPPSGEARRSPRIQTENLVNIVFETALDSKSVSIPIHNLSSTGAGLGRAALERWPQRGEKLSGELVYDGHRIPLSLKIVRISSTAVGVIFDRPSMEVSKLLQQYFSVEISALVLRPVKAEALSSVPEGRPTWLTGPSHSELYYVRAENGEIPKLEIVLFGNRFKVSSQARATYEDVGMSEGDEPSAAPPKEMREAYVRMIQSLEVLPSEDRSALTKLVNKS